LTDTDKQNTTRKHTN